MTIRHTLGGAIAALALLALLAAAVPAWGQAAKKEIPEPEDLTLETKDGVSLRCTYYPGMAKKASIPIIMIHGWEGQRSEYDGLALALQSLGHTIIVPDLRGHGQSTIVKLANGDTEPIDPGKFRQKELESMTRVIQDVGENLIERASAFSSALAQIAKDYEDTEVGRDTSKEELNAILARYPKTADIKG